MSELVEKLHSSVPEAAVAYFEMGYFPIQIRPDKRPFDSGWPNIVYESADDVRSAFQSKKSNVGLVLGPSGLIDMDLDWHNTSLLASYFLPQTGAIFGHEGKPDSHWIYAASEVGPSIGIPPPFSTDKKDMIIELRCGPGHQTVFPSSNWRGKGKSEPIRFKDGFDPTQGNYQVLAEATNQLAAASFLQDAWTDGQRNQLTLHLAGALMEFDWSDEGIIKFVTAIAEVSGDTDLKGRIKVIRATRKKYDAGEAITGLPTLCELLTSEGETEPRHKKLRQWLTKLLDKRQPSAGRRSVKGVGGRKKKLEFKEALYAFAIAEADELWCSDNEQPFASIGHRVIDLSSESGNDWLRELSDDMGKVPSSGQIRDVRAQLAVRCRRGPKYPVCVRLAGDRKKGEIYIDVGDAERNIIIIDKDGWQITKDCPVRFFRPPTMKPLPLPDASMACDVNVLSSFINLDSEQDLHLLLAWILGALNPFIQYPHLNLYGEQGTGKSTATQFLRDIVDPSQQALKAPPRNEDDIVISALNQHVLSMDNFSYIKNDLSDALCRLSTGASFGKRKLYSDTQEITVNFRKPAIINGIANLPDRSDLLDRMLIVNMSRLDLPDSELDFRDAFHDMLPGLLATIYTAMSKAIPLEKTIKFQERVRLHDFYRWAKACFQGLGLPEEALPKAILANEAHRLTDHTESDRFAKDVLSIVYFAVQGYHKGLNYWEVERVDPAKEWPLKFELGTATESLLDSLQGLYIGGFPDLDDKYPRTGKMLSQRLNRSHPGLVPWGVRLKSQRKGRNSLNTRYAIVSKEILEIPGNWIRENHAHTVESIDGDVREAKLFTLITEEPY